MWTLLRSLLVICTWAFAFGQKKCPTNTEVFLGDTKGLVKWSVILNNLSDKTKPPLDFPVEDPNGVFLSAEEALIDISLAQTPNDLLLLEVSLETKLIQLVEIKNTGDKNEPNTDTPSPEWETSRFEFDGILVNNLQIQLVSSSGEMKVKNVIVRGCVPVQWCEWGNWGGCKVSCGEGVRTRDRDCNCANPNLPFICEGSPKKTEICTGPCCKQPPSIGKWSGWDTCTVTCGGGEQQRSRKCIDHECPDGTDCPEKKNEKRPCNEQCCIGDSKWSKWTEWGTCSLSCGEGLRSRNRECKKDPDCPTPGAPKCPGDDIQTEKCNEGCCEVPPFWSNWKPWDTCPVSCGGGIQERRRICNQDEECPIPGGKCPGKGTDSRTCNDDCCPVEPIWKKWGKWGECSVSCGTGVQTRKRKCKKDKLCPLIGAKCKGPKKGEQDCDKPCCTERIDFKNRDGVMVHIRGGLESRDGAHLFEGSGGSMENILLKNIDGAEKVEITFKDGARKDIIQVGVETFLSSKIMLEAGEWEDTKSANPKHGADFTKVIFDAPGGQANNIEKITLKFGYPTGEIAVKSLFLIVCV